MFDHVVLSVRSIERSIAFYEAVLRPLGITKRITYPGHPDHAPLEGFGDSHERYLLLKTGTPDPGSVHLAFRARTRSTVKAFYEAALAAGGKDNGKPGSRMQYFPEYYAAYVLDLDGYNVEAVYLEG